MIELLQVFDCPKGPPMIDFRPARGTSSACMADGPPCSITRSASRTTARFNPFNSAANSGMGGYRKNSGAIEVYQCPNIDTIIHPVYTNRPFRKFPWAGISARLLRHPVDDGRSGRNRFPYQKLPRQ